jgi:hypothetical protein
VVKNTTAPESALKKRHNAIAYHRAREAQAAGIIRVWCDADCGLAHEIDAGASIKGIDRLCVVVIVWLPKRNSSMFKNIPSNWRPLLDCGFVWRLSPNDVLNEWGHVA